MKRQTARALRPDTPMQDYVFSQASDMIRRTAFRANRARVLRNAESIHDLRVSTRRLIECVRLFGQFFPREKARRVRRTLKKAIDLASEVRNRDIALELLRRTHLASDVPLLKSIAEERLEAAGALRVELQQWSKKNIQKRWRSKLGL